MAGSRDAIDTFELVPGRVIGGKYVVETLLGRGWEGEVYKVHERRTEATRAAKLFFPQRNERDRAVTFYARKLEQLRDCSLVIKYHHSETMQVKGCRVTALVSEFVEGAILSKFVQNRPGRRLQEFEALHLTRELVRGIEEIHARREYHGDLHWHNVLVKRRGVHFDVKIVDLFDLGRPTAANRRHDVQDVIRILYDMLGGRTTYRTQRDEVKYIIAGLRRDLQEKRFPSARALREHLDSFEWASEAS